MEAGLETHRAPTSGGRLDLVLLEWFPGHSRARLQSWIEHGRVTVDGRMATKPGVRLRGGEKIVVHLPSPGPARAVPEAIPLDVLFENRDLVVINKPAGMVVHPSAGHPSGTIVNAVLAHAPDLTGVGDEMRPGIVHRLDRDTSGLLVVAKNEPALRMLQDQFHDREVEKVYLALVDGQPPDRRGRIEAPLGRDPRHRQRMAIVSPSRGREASTEYRVQQLFPAHALLEVRPRTGRTHQIRVHLAFLDCPVSGDRVYGRRSARPIAARQMLHAWKLRLRLPGGPDVLQEFEAPLPSDMIRAIETAAAG